MDECEKAVEAIVKARAAGESVGAKDAPVVKPKRLRNLAPAWRPGESGNPAGKPAGAVSLKRILQARLSEVPPGADRRTLAELIVDQTCRDALHGDAAARKLIWESIDGPPRMALDVTAVQAVDPAEARERIQDRLDKYADEITAYTAEANRISGCYCDRLDCASRRDTDG